MALSDLKFAPLPTQAALVVPESGVATVFFRDWLTDLTNRIVGSVAALNAAVAAIQSANAAQIAAQQAAVSAAQATAAAQAAADSAGGSSAQSGDAMLTIAVPAGGGWSPGPLVNLAGVVAGTLSAVNSSPAQQSNTEVVSEGIFTGNYRIVEIVGAVETTKFTGQYQAERTQEDVGFITIVFNLTDTTTFTVGGQASTGAVSYRMDANSPDVDVVNLAMYLSVRRS